MTSWHRNEYILKGLFWGLWTFIALQVAVDPNAVRVDLPWVLGWVGAGLGVGFLCGAILQFRRGVKPWANWKAFPILVLLESPTFIYCGIVFGLALGVFSGRETSQPWAEPIANWFGIAFDQIRHLRSEDMSKPGDWLLYCVLGGTITGLVLYQLRKVEDPKQRFVAGLAIAAAAVYFGGEYASLVPGLAGPEGKEARFDLGLYILLGLPFFYLLTFCSEAEESEAEIMALCAALGTGIYLLDLPSIIPNLGSAIAFLVPVSVYFVYATRVLPGLRVFKHVLRGYSYMNLGRLREAIYFFRRALELDPTSALARQGMAALHNNLSLAKIENDPVLVEIVDFGMCLDRAEGYLIGGASPTAEQREEAERFLKLVEQKKPAYQARVDYLRAVSLTYAKDYDAAASLLSKLLSPETPDYHPKVRQAALFPAWNLALLWSAEIEKRVGWKELEKPGRRIEAIAATERQIASDPQDSAAKDLKTLLYSQLQESEFVAAAVGGPPKNFNYDYVEQLGLALIEDPDPERRERGMAYMRIAGRGLVERGPAIFKKLADASEKAGDAEAMRAYLEQIKRCGLFVQPGNLAKDQREIYFAALKRLASEAEAASRPEAAIADLRLYLEGGGAGELNVYRKLAELHGQLGDAMNAILMVETGLAYNSTDSDFLKKKDSYYYSLTEEKLVSVKEKVASYFDVSYCVKKAMAILNAKSDDLELVDWATHLSKLAAIMQPSSHGVRLVQARCLLRQGDRDGGISIMEDIREGKKGSGEDEEAWYAASKILGQLYLDELERPDLAAKAFLDYKEYSKSGADTLYQIGRAYEAQNDAANAIRFYEAVTAYEAHPRFWDAKEALRRLGKE